MTMKASMCWLATVAFAKSARFKHLRLRIENQTSMKDSQDACTGKKWKWNLRAAWSATEWRGRTATAQEVETAIKSLRELLGAEHLQAGRGQLDRQGNAIQA